MLNAHTRLAFILTVVSLVRLNGLFFLSMTVYRFVVFLSLVFLYRKKSIVNDCVQIVSPQGIAALIYMKINCKL